MPSMAASAFSRPWCFSSAASLMNSVWGSGSLAPFAPSGLVCTAASVICVPSPVFRSCARRFPPLAVHVRCPLDRIYSAHIPPEPVRRSTVALLLPIAHVLCRPGCALPVLEPHHDPWPYDSAPSNVFRTQRRPLRRLLEPSRPVSATAGASASPHPLAVSPCMHGACRKCQAFYSFLMQPCRPEPAASRSPAVLR